MEVEEPDTNRLTTYSNLVESNCEYLTFIKNIVIPRTKMQRDSIKTLDSYMQDTYKNQTKTKLHFQGLVQLIIELAYFLYSCKNFGKKPEIELDDIRVEQSYLKSGEKRFNIVVFYKISDESIEENLGSVLFKSIMEHIEQALHDYIQNRRESPETTTSGDSEYEAAFEVFWRQFQLIAENEVLAEDQVKFFLYLEQTSLFYEYSLFYRIKNCSLLDYIRTIPARMAIFKEFKDKQENLLNNYQQEKKRLKGDQEVLKAKKKEIDKNLENFFEKINENNVEAVQKNEKDPSNKVKFNFRLKEKEKTSFEQLLAALQGETAMSEEGKKDLRRPLAELEYFVEFSAERNSICVKLFLPSIVVNVQTSDFLMFQSNVLTFDAANVSIELSQPKLKTEEKAPPKKVVTFKGTSSFNSSNTKEPLLEKVLLLMDITMIASRIYEPEMSSQKYVQGGKESYFKLNNVSKKVSHYTKLFMRCAKKVYDQ